MFIRLPAVFQSLVPAINKISADDHLDGWGEGGVLLGAAATAAAEKLEVRVEERLGKEEL